MRIIHWASAAKVIELTLMPGSFFVLSSRILLFGAAMENRDSEKSRRGRGAKS